MSNQTNIHSNRVSRIIGHLTSGHDTKFKATKIPIDNSTTKKKNDNDHHHHNCHHHHHNKQCDNKQQVCPSSNKLKPNTKLAGLELGGTTIKVAIAEGCPTNVILSKVFPTTSDPIATLQPAIEIIKKAGVEAIGIGSFGPVDLKNNSQTYGYITTTPKEGWKDCDVLRFFRPLGVPIGFQTDVNAAALGEFKHGNHGEIDSLAYITVGTGIGVGLVINGKALFGLLHPEAGHIRVARHPDDKYKGICPIHKDCLEGLATANAVAARGNKLITDLEKEPDDSKLWEFEAFYLGQLCANLALTVSPHVIVMGGGVLKQRSLLQRIRSETLKQLNGYLRVPKITGSIEKYIVKSRFDHPDMKNTSAGLVGALEVGRLALECK